MKSISERSSSTIEVVLHGALSAYSPEPGRAHVALKVSEPHKACEVYRLLGVPEESVSFVARNRSKCSKEEIISPGDRLDVFPPLIGGNTK
ncbi:MAG TPA: hypothetical protein GX507_10455 [Clostridia bacterium]|nr:hypothetical protein [Clostridia bacterium]